MIQLTVLKGKFKGQYEKLNKTFTKYSLESIFNRLFTRQVIRNSKKFKELIPNWKVDDFPIRPIILSIGTATDRLAKYLAQLLKTFSESRYTVKEAKDFTKKIRI